MTRLAYETSQAARLREIFVQAGAQPVECTILQPADTLLDLYGEDIRGRAYVTSDALRGEQMLRPDFTVPVVQMHMAHGAAPARYTYAGPVFRRQEDDAARANEYMQVGYEVFDGANLAAADAEVFALIRDALGAAPLRAATGDIGILTAAVSALNTTERRKAALMRHIWRPRRFRALIDRFAGRTPVPPARATLLAAPDPFADCAPMIGLRSRREIAARISALHADAKAPPIPEAEVALIDAILSVRETLPYALERLRDIAVDMPAIAPAVEQLAARMAALQDRGVDVERLDFEASYGRTTMEYYDGFVFGFYAEARPDLPPVASGGRYDALTRVLGQGLEIPAVGGVIRPGLLADLEGTA
ncbi:ATP phosphoribosyltransferase regulatory subunit [Lutimaribacter sp. EGI FJ00015]|uniref:ATP phosphoribosyltransferase regulatory subunit n=1 Tax=Lutimaribacter degradans TaxID=2945989 RepID=A0ACC6A0X3_9RHOB|nr:ATP phosphoribosyltransferase regulatory subunit [Lutimaribacter sp. EGI FJ00013]MCM2563646.1 ATP phosphoribosyltransferase regulatory subunit [Lutimaribacter sp. EGI FJ00013]MCO0614818.1 ATP phosphoribosyltransferase regulatory subunit [Lutimaribacter sp. EGI FJ00015]MCO0637498.1 ATP phosphoribosyltransferase regulatory subunit [Lutimaribacter sp. EGI FJ00014]